jgi:hypothetical protein
MRLGRTIPALPVRSIGPAVEYYLSRFGFSCPHQDTGFAIVVRDDAEVHLWESGDEGWRSRPSAELLDSPVCSGAETFIAGTASCRIQVDDVDALYAELSMAGVLHPIDEGSPVDTEYGTREFATVDRDGNLLTFYRRS